MKTSERRQLKTNEVAQTVARLRETYDEHRTSITWGLVATIALAALVGGGLAWRSRRGAEAQAMLAEAMTVATAPVAPAATPTAAGQTPPAPPAGSFPTEQARARAALDKFLAAANRFGTTEAGLAARYRAAALLAELGRTADAEREFRTVADGGGSTLYGRMARLGVAEMQVKAGQFDPAINTYRELAGHPDGDLPVDGVLMRLGRAYTLAGRRAEALQTFNRIVQEFPQSLYVADARREADSLKSS